MGVSIRRHLEEEKMSKGKTKVKVKANIKKTFNEVYKATDDVAFIEVLERIDSTTSQNVGVMRNNLDRLICDVVVIFNSSMRKDLSVRQGGVYVYKNVDIKDYIWIRSQLLRGNSAGKVVGKVLVNSEYDYERLNSNEVLEVK